MRSIVRHPALPLMGAAALGFAGAMVLFAVAMPRPASAQLGGRNPAGGLGNPGGPNGYPNLSSLQGSFSAAVPQPAQPLEVQSLEADRFVVATREPRLITQDGKTAQNVLLTVVTHYTVRENRLIPIEHVKVPMGYQLVTVEQ